MGTIAPIKDESILMTGILRFHRLVAVHQAPSVGTLQPARGGTSREQ